MAHPLLRASVVVFSATLLIGFVVFRAGGCSAKRDATSASAASQPTTSPFVVMPGSKSGNFDRNGQNVLYGDGTVEFFPGSKSGPIVPVDTAKEFRTMAGSKSMVITEGGIPHGFNSPAQIITGPTTRPTTTPAEPPR
jgi:hypothetical protein